METYLLREISSAASFGSSICRGVAFRANLPLEESRRHRRSACRCCAVALLPSIRFALHIPAAGVDGPLPQKLCTKKLQKQVAERRSEEARKRVGTE
eukprot:237018-Rhodomonas_salina.1